MKGQEANRLRAIGAKAHPSGSYPVKDQPNVYSVLVSVQDMQEWREAGDAGAYGSIGPQWYRVGVYHDPNTGQMSMLGKGYQVPGPTADAPPVLASDMKKADPNEPRTMSVQGFLSAWMPKPPKDKEGQGDVTPWVTDGLEVATFHSPQIESVKVTHTAFTPLPAHPGAADTRPRINADVMIEVAYRSGTTAQQLVTLTLAPAGESGSRYVVDGLPGQPGAGQRGAGADDGAGGRGAAGAGAAALVAADGAPLPGPVGGGHRGRGGGGAGLPRHQPRHGAARRAAARMALVAHARSAGDGGGLRAAGWRGAGEGDGGP